MNQDIGNGPRSDRDREVDAWLNLVAGRDHRWEPASSDASFRRYLRVYLDGGTRIVMDAPPGREDCRPFVHAQSLLRAAGVNVPEIIEADLDRGLLLLSDLGRSNYLDSLDAGTCDALYADALVALERMQLCIEPDQVPAFDRDRLGDELRLFPEWFLDRHLELETGDVPAAELDNCFEFLIATCLEQPQVFVHRDYHSRNLMCVEQNNPGVLDFQDAVSGPVTYDLVSLFRDVYIAWPDERIYGWVTEYFERLKQRLPALERTDEAQFFRWFDLTGIQRHLKVAGIFCRLWHRDGKPGYLEDIPLTLRYLCAVGARHAETRPLVEALRALEIESRLGAANAAVRAATGDGAP